MTIADIAAALEPLIGRRVSTTTAFSWEQEKPYLAPPADTVFALAKILGCEPDDFYFYPKVARDELRPGNRQPHRYKSDSPGDRLDARFRSDKWRKSG